MYRTMLYFLGIVLGTALVFGGLGIFPYRPVDIVLQTIFLAGVCWSFNEVFSRLLKIKPNPESSLITALILSSISGPFPLAQNWHLLAVIGGAAMASKYVLVWNRSHVFNPAAIGATAGLVMFGQEATWWTSDKFLLPLIALGGIIVVSRIRRFDIVISFFAVLLGLLALGDVHVWRFVQFSPVFFFAFVMLVEPLTSPQTKPRRIAFGALVGALSVVIPRVFASVAFPWELSLFAGNAFARFGSPDFRQAFALREKHMLTPLIGTFWFEPSKPFAFVPGQFLEYTLWHPHADSRGIRRYFTIASSPTENRILVATRFAQQGSTFKKFLRAMNPGDEIVASKVAGDFVLPQDKSLKLAFIAGGIGITPFRSMVKYLLDTNQSRNIAMVYGARSEEDFAFRELFEKAGETFAMRTAYTIKALDGVLISKEIPDFKERIFYVSGPEPMVEAMERVLGDMGVPPNRIRRDYFPGYEWLTQEG